MPECYCVVGTNSNSFGDTLSLKTIYSSYIFCSPVGPCYHFFGFLKQRPIHGIPEFDVEGTTTNEYYCSGRRESLFFCLEY
jgi:hypothetical protein